MSRRNPSRGPLDCSVALTPSEAEALRARLVAGADVTPTCWLWRGSKRNGQHGSLSYRDYPEYAHRLSYLAHNGPIAPGHYVCHRCDVPACVNPEHLFAGPPVANVADMHAKGRARKRPRFGLANHKAKLTSEQVAEIRRLVALPGSNQHDVARRFGCSQSTVWRLVRRQTRTADDRAPGLQ